MTDEQFNPDDHTVSEVQAHLADLPDTPEGDAERGRILAVESQGQNRKGVMSLEVEPEAPSEQAGDRPGDETTVTKAATFAEAATAATPDEGKGYLGFSPEVERTGRRDKGLSQQNPAIMSGGPIPDPRPNVDDSEALAALEREV